MAVNLGAITPVLYSLATSGVFWVIAIVFMLILGVVLLKVKQKRKIKIPTLIYTRLGNGKIGIKQTKSGWLKRNRKMFNLIETGSNEELVTRNYQVINGATPEDYHEFNGYRTLIVTPSIDDPDILFPISKFDYSENTKEILMDFPPIEIREAAVDNYKKTVVEMKNPMDQVIQYVIVGLFFIVAFLVILFITQYGKHMVDKSTEQQKEANSFTKEAIASNQAIAKELSNLVDKINGEPINRVPEPYTAAP
jgi:large-conductance mechanosensitive channel